MLLIIYAYTEPREGDDSARYRLAHGAVTSRLPGGGVGDQRRRRRDLTSSPLLLPQFQRRVRAITGSG
jgi:hypothetical protein